MSKTTFEVHMKHLKVLKLDWNETDDKILPVFAQFLGTLFPSSHGKLVLVLFQATIYIFSFFKRWKKNCNILEIILVPGFCAQQNWNCSISYRISTLSLFNDNPPREPRLRASSSPIPRTRMWSVVLKLEITADIPTLGVNGFCS